MLNDDYNDRMVAIDPVTGALVWQYGVTGEAAPPRDYSAPRTVSMSLGRAASLQPTPRPVSRDRCMRSFLSPRRTRPGGTAQTFRSRLRWGIGETSRRAVSAGQEVTAPPHAEHGKQSTKSDAGSNRPLAQACSRNLVTSTPVVVEWSEPGGIEQVGEHMHCHGHEPKDKAGFVDKKKLSSEAMRGEQQGDPACEKRERQQHNHRAEHTQQRRRWALAPVGRRTGIVADEAIAGAAHLQQDGRHQ